MASLVVGLVTGLVCASFRLAVDRADTARASLLVVSPFPAWGWLVPVAAAAWRRRRRGPVVRIAPATAAASRRWRPPSASARRWMGFGSWW
jgi:hypothetical protein